MGKLETLIVLSVASASFAIVGVISYNMGVTDTKLKQELLENHIENGNSIKFIWNDDEESIPKDGSLIRIEMTVDNTVYLSLIE